MNDHDLQENTTLSLAERAVRYMLDRIRVDPDLRYLMGGTQAFAMLCEAEAARTGKSPEAVQFAAMGPLNHPDARRPARLPSHRDLLDCCEELLAIWPLSGYQLEAFCSETLVPMMRKAVDKARGSDA
jgi:hypothetical protein